MPAQTLDRSIELCLIGHFNDDCSRAKDLLLQHLIAFQQQADIRLEQLRLGLTTLLHLSGHVLDTIMAEQRLQTFAITAQGARIEHGLRRLLADLPCQLLDKRRKRWRANADDQTGVGAELPTPLHHRRRQFTGNRGAACRQGLRQDHHRVDARHLGEYRNWLRSCCRHVTQRTAAVQ